MKYIRRKQNKTTQTEITVTCCGLTLNLFSILSESSLIVGALKLLMAS